MYYHVGKINPLVIVDFNINLLSIIIASSGILS